MFVDIWVHINRWDEIKMKHLFINDVCDFFADLDNNSQMLEEVSFNFLHLFTMS